MNCRIAMRGAISGRIGVKTEKIRSFPAFSTTQIFAIPSTSQDSLCVPLATASICLNRHGRFSSSRKFFHLQ
jgi:hypothetical protein